MFNFEQLSEQVSPRVYITGNRSKQLCKWAPITTTR